MSRIRSHLLAACAAIAAVAAPALAWANARVALRPDIADQDGRVTLGDLFDGAGQAASVVVANGRPGAGLVLDAGRVQLVARANGLDWVNDAGVRRVVVRPGVSQSTVTVVARVSRGVDVLSYAHSLNTGDIVHAEDLVWGKSVAPAADAPRDPQAMIGMAARHALREGSAAALHDVAAPQVIKREDIISLTYMAEGVTLTLQAKALQNANAGDSFSAINPESKKIIQAVAVGPGHAVVGPGAEQFKAAARLNPSLLASLR